MTFLKWFFTNALFFSLLIAGLCYGLDWAYNIGLFWVLVCGVLGFVLCFSSDEFMDKLYKEGQKPYNKTMLTLDIVFDFSIVALLASFGHFFLAVVYLVQMAGIQNTQKMNDRNFNKD